MHCPIVDEALGTTDHTLGGMYYTDGDLSKPSGTKFRGQSEERVLRRMEHRAQGGCEKCNPEKSDER